MARFSVVIAQVCGYLAPAEVFIGVDQLPRGDEAPNRMNLQTPTAPSSLVGSRCARVALVDQPAQHLAAANLRRRRAA